MSTSGLRRDKVVTDYETRWAVIGPLGAVDFHCSNTPVGHGFGRIGGIEEHRRAPADYQRADEPSHTDCRLLDGNCWHDGSSLYASDVLIPLLERDGEDAMWAQLEREYAARFEATHV